MREQSLLVMLPVKPKPVGEWTVIDSTHTYAAVLKCDRVRSPRAHGDAGRDSECHEFVPGAGTGRARKPEESEDAIEVDPGESRIRRVA